MSFPAESLARPIVLSAKSESANFPSVIGIVNPSNQVQIDSVRVCKTSPGDVASIAEPHIVLYTYFLCRTGGERQYGTLPWRKRVSEDLGFLDTVEAGKLGRYHHFGICAPQRSIALASIKYEKISLQAVGSEGRLGKGNKFNSQSGPMGNRVGSSHIFRLLAVNEDLNATNYDQAEGEDSKQPICDACAEESVVRGRGIACIVSLLVVCAGWSFWIPLS